MLKLKGCPKCGGDVQLDNDHYGWYEQCIQCGFMRDVPNIIEVKSKMVEEESKEFSKVRKRDKNRDNSFS